MAIVYRCNISKGNIKQSVSRYAEYCAPIYRVHWEQRAAPKFTDFIWACNPAWRISRPVLFPGTGTREVHTPPSARYHAWHNERNRLKNHVCYCNSHRGKQHWQDGVIKFPRFCLHKVNEAPQNCGVFLLRFWHTGSSVVVISEEKTFLASIGKEYPFPYFRPPVLRCVGWKLLVGKCPKPSEWKGAIAWTDAKENYKSNSM